MLITHTYSSIETVPEAVVGTKHPKMELHETEPRKVNVVGVLVTALLLNEQVERMTVWAKQRLSRVVCVANVHMLMEARRDPNLSLALVNADLVTPDGMPLVWMMRSLGATTQDRVAGMDIFRGVCKRCMEEDISIYLIGSTQVVLDGMISRLRQDFPGLKVAGAESPPFRKLSESENAATVKRINDSGAGVTFVSLGCPKQERWMAKNYGKVSSVMIGVGAVFPVYAGVKRHAPEWVRHNGLEWLYRWIQEPRRLTGRYLRTIPLFIFLALIQAKFSRASFCSVPMKLE